ncbi:MAG TPA: sugar ABC transporter ATP-binding protein [Armatimonadetes bacterium]|nr:sugar ABC transporter ATP-binding protein [Armatimonadota bacterium]
MAQPPQPSPESTPLLSMTGIVKQFPGVRALDGVDFQVRRGEIHSLMGQNGAGKSTLLKVLTGVYTRDAGQMLLDGRVISPRSPLEAQGEGISTVYQEVNLIPDLSVAENIVLGRQTQRFGFIDWRAARRQADAALARLDLQLDVSASLNSYSIAIQQMVAIARALDEECSLLVLDEPTSSLDQQEVARLFGVLRRLRDDGLGIVFVTHFLDQVYQISDTITVLRNGRLVGEWPAAEFSRIELIARMLGRDPASLTEAEAGAAPPSPVAAAEAARLVAHQLGRRGQLQPVDVEVGAGEVLGLGGLLGSGRTELARLLFGLDRADSGRVELAGRAVRRGQPRSAIAAGMGYSSEDRKVEGIIPELSVRENLILALASKRGLWRRLGRAAQEALADRYIQALGIATPDAEKRISELSGGNQQKVLLARWLAAEPSLLILDEPTRGIDVGAKAEIMALVADLKARGMSVVFISSELEEVVRSSDRIMVLCDRAALGELRGESKTEQAMLARIASAHQEVSGG